MLEQLLNGLGEHSASKPAEHQNIADEFVGCIYIPQALFEQLWLRTRQPNESQGTLQGRLEAVGDKFNYWVGGVTPYVGEDTPSACRTDMPIDESHDEGHWHTHTEETLRRHGTYYGNNFSGLDHDALVKLAREKDSGVVVELLITPTDSIGAIAFDSGRVYRMRVDVVD